MNKVQILKEAQIIFDSESNVEPINLKLTTDREDVNTDLLSLSVCNANKKILNCISMWRYYSYNMTHGYEVIQLRLTYTYDIKQPLGKATKWITTTYTRLQIKQNHETKKETVTIVGSGVNTEKENIK